MNSLEIVFQSLDYVLSGGEVGGVKASFHVAQTAVGWAGAKCTTVGSRQNIRS